MLAGVFSRGLARLGRSFVSHCDAAPNAEETPSLIEQADAAIENEKAKIRTPMQFENLKNTLSQGSVHPYDGFRVIVQKQVNLNSVVSHFYWIGSQNLEKPIYQYRLILPFDEKVVNVATDMDFNVEGEVKAPLTSNISAKANFLLKEDQKEFTTDFDVVDDSSATQLQLSATDKGHSLSVSYMQAISPSLTLGGVGQYILKKNLLKTGFGGVYDDGSNLVAAQWAMDNEFRALYTRRVNPNRVHLSTELTVDPTLQSKMAVAAEYTMKQSKLQMSMDSDMVLRSTLDSQVAPGVTMQFCAEMHQRAEQYRFGYGIIMG